MSDRAWDMQDFRKLLFGSGRSGMGDMFDIRDTMKNTMMPFYQDIIKNKGFSQEFKNRLGADMMGTLRQTKQSDEADIDKQVAGLGMTGTGLALRNKQALADKYRRDVMDSQNKLEFGSRDELWRGMEGFGDLSRSMFDMTAQREALKQQKDAQSFGGSFKRGLGSALGGGLGGAFFGGGK